MAIKQYYSVTTRRFTLRCGHEEWLRMTQELYNEVILFYYLLFADLEEREPGSLTSLSAQQILRNLEVQTIVGRDKNAVSYPLPWVKLPLYLRRAAINEATSCARTYFSSRKAGKFVGKTEKFHKGITFYKGMYRDLTEKGVTIKVWNEKAWTWITCRISGNFIPSQAQPLSPSIYYHSQGITLFLPVKAAVEDGRKAEERIHQGCRVCSIQFANEDYFAVGVVLDERGEQTAVRFFKGGKEYAHRCTDLMNHIQKSEQAMGMDETEGRNKDAEGKNKETEGRNKDAEERYNQKYWMKYKHLRQNYAHLISRQITDFCLEADAAVMALPKYTDKYTKCVMAQTGICSSLHLSRSIRDLLSYKAWQAGIIVLEVNSKDTSSYCAICGSSVKRKKDYYWCLEGHQGNKFLNSARNIGVKCLKGFGREWEDEQKHG